MVFRKAFIWSSFCDRTVRQTCRHQQRSAETKVPNGIRVCHFGTHWNKSGFAICHCLAKLVCVQAYPIGIFCRKLSCCGLSRQMIAVDLINENRPVSQFGPPVGLFLIAVYGYTHAGPTASVAAKSIQEVVDLNHIEQRISDFFCKRVSKDDHIIRLDQDPLRRILKCFVEVNSHCDRTPTG
jgi:hypothetical protein